MSLIDLALSFAAIVNGVAVLKLFRVLRNNKIIK